MRCGGLNLKPYQGSVAKVVLTILTDFGDARGTGKRYSSAAQLVGNGSFCCCFVLRFSFMYVGMDNPQREVVWGWRKNKQTNENSNSNPILSVYYADCFKVSGPCTANAGHSSPCIHTCMLAQHSASISCFWLFLILWSRATFPHVCGARWEH